MIQNSDANWTYHITAGSQNSDRGSALRNTVVSFGTLQGRERGDLDRSKIERSLCELGCGWECPRDPDLAQRASCLASSLSRMNAGAGGCPSPRRAPEIRSGSGAGWVRKRERREVATAVGEGEG
jgi:hypothetical protein